MSCCGSDEEEEQRPDPTRVRGCTDIFWLILFIIFWCLMVRNFSIYFLRIQYYYSFLFYTLCQNNRVLIMLQRSVLYNWSIESNAFGHGDSLYFLTDLVNSLSDFNSKCFTDFDSCICFGVWKSCPSHQWIRQFWQHLWNEKQSEIWKYGTVRPRHQWKAVSIIAFFYFTQNCYRLVTF